MPQELNPDSMDLAAIVRAGDTVMWGQAAAEPLPLTRALMARRHAIGRFNVFLGATYSDTLKPEYADCVDFSSYCGAGSNRVLARAGKLDILPCHYSQLPGMIARGRLKIDVLMLQVAPADDEGCYSLGIAHEYLVPAIDTARVVIAEVNEDAPWTYGERMLREGDLDYIVRTSRAPLELRHPPPNAAELAIAGHVAGMVDDGATLQFGLGALPETILSRLADRRDLGVHSGGLGDQAAALMEAGVITNRRKSIDAGYTVAGVMLGGRRVHEYAHRNPAVQFRSTSYTHDPDVLARIDRFVAINSAVEVDLTGQINAEVAGGIYVGAVGGSLDFLRGAHRSKGGLPVVALPSTAGAASRIVSRLNGPVTTPRSDAGLIVTEYGIADLRGLPLSRRVGRMIAVAHPDFRERLAKESEGILLC
ncbi:MAG: acetyl-CoA hydrolase/transferase C-terminal domain-containing protein [bacterium]|nr:acetyl-CoA hydrolase/transferase C-terminal domain-containing protein [bacterium]